MNKIIVSGLLVLAAASGASWSGVASAEEGKSLTLAVNIDLNTWDPFYDVNNDDLKAIVFEAPLRIVGQTVKPWLAERWRSGSLRFTKARMRWMICPARRAWWLVFCSAVSSASCVSCPLSAREIMPLQ